MTISNPLDPFTYLVYNNPQHVHPNTAAAGHPAAIRPSPLPKGEPNANLSHPFSPCPLAPHPYPSLMPRCTTTRADGHPCRAWAVRGTDPPLCAAHGGAEHIGAPPGNQNALKHGFYADPDLPVDCTIDAVIDVLFQRQLQLDDFLDTLWNSGITIQDLAHLLRIHGQNASRLGRLLRDRRALSGDAADGISGAIAQALDELGTEMGVDL